MNNSLVISVIIPVFNTEQYFNNCLDSVCVQSYNSKNILLIDDGSYDCSSNICDEYSIVDNQYYVLHRANAGVSSARNAGLDISLGSCIAFIDADDYVETTMLEKLVRILAKRHADIVNCCILRYNEQNGLVHQSKPFEYMDTNNVEGVKLLLKNKIPVVPWNKLYKKNVLKKYRFPERMCYEDEYIMPYLFMSTTKISYINECLYHYMEHSGSIIHSKIGKADIDRLEALENHIKKFGPNFPELIDNLKIRYITACSDIFSKAMLDHAPLSTKKKIYSMLKKYMDNVITQLPLGLKLECCAAKCGFNIYFVYKFIRLKF